MRKRYRFLSKKGEGTFSEVLKAKCISTNKLVATKCMKEHFSSIDEVNNLREIQALKRLNPHENIINLYEVVFEKKSGRLTLVFELMDMNLYMYIRKTNGYISDEKIIIYMYQLLKAIDHIHKRGIFHRDIKPENILIAGNKLKLADFGSCRGKYSKQPFTEYISTRWYRAPECLLTDGYYDSKMDIWGVGCVFFEIIALFPLFPGTNELDQIERIHRVLGTPTKKLLDKFKKKSSHIRVEFKPTKGTGIHPLIPHINNTNAINLLNQLLIYDPKRRITAYQSLKHRYFDEVYEIQSKHGMHRKDSTSTINGKTIKSVSSTKSLLNKTLSSSSILQKTFEETKNKIDKLAEKHAMKIEGTTATQTNKVIETNKNHHNKYGKDHEKQQDRKRKKSYVRHKTYDKYKHLNNNMTLHKNNNNNHRHSNHHHDHQKKTHYQHRHRLKKDKHSRTQIKLPTLKKHKTHIHSEKKSMIAMSKLHHAHSTKTLLSTTYTNPNELLPTIQSMKYQRLSKSKYLTHNKRLPPVSVIPNH